MWKFIILAEDNEVLKLFKDLRSKKENSNQEGWKCWIQSEQESPAKLIYKVHGEWVLYRQKYLNFRTDDILH